MIILNRAITTRENRYLEIIIEGTGALRTGRSLLVKTTLWN